MKHFFILGWISLLISCKSTGVDANCCDTAGYSVVAPDSIRIVAPNIITPNGDGKNDEMRVYISDSTDVIPLSRFTTRRLTVYNSFGVPIISASDFKNDFSGKGRAGQDLPEGKYRYELVLDSYRIQSSLCIVRNGGHCGNGCRYSDNQDPLLCR